MAHREACPKMMVFFSAMTNHDQITVFHGQWSPALKVGAALVNDALILWSLVVDFAMGRASHPFEGRASKAEKISS